MSLYYQDEYVTLYLGDCLTEHREWLEADVLVTDPPYGTQFTKGNPRGGYGRRQKSTPEGFIVAGDTTTETRDSALSAWGDRAVAVFSSPRAPEPPGEWLDRLIWDKVEPGMNGGPFRYTHENISLRGEGWRKRGASNYSVMRFPRSDGMGNAERSQHAHRKPVGLMEALIAAFPLGVVADPFAGSGSTLVAAKNLGRRVIGVELEEKYCEIAANRCSQDLLNFGAAS
jgi:DNA modification methylase